jgi:hypothetical protein
MILTCQDVSVTKGQPNSKEERNERILDGSVGLKPPFAKRFQEDEEQNKVWQRRR